MNDLNDDNLDVLLREHFKAELDGQLDRAPAVQARSSRRLPWRAVFWPLAAAAAVAIVMLPGIRSLLQTPQGPRQPSPPIVQAGMEQPVEHQIQWNTIDEGTVFVNGDIPMRSIRRQRLDNVRWIDPSTNATMEMSVPHDEVVLVGLHAN